MLESSQRTASHHRGLLDDVIDEIAERIQQGRDVDITAYAERYPQYAERLRELLPTMEAVACSLKREAHFAADRQPSSAGQEAADPFAAEQDADVEPFRIGEFEIRRDLGRGGMGIVYEAYQPSVNRRVALKILPFAALLDSDQVRRFRFEAEIAAKLDHPNIVDVYSAGRDQDKNIHYFVMEFVEGPTVAEVIAHMREQSGEFQKRDPITRVGETTYAGQRPDHEAVPRLATGKNLGSTLDETHLSVHGFISPGEDNSALSYVRSVASLIAKAARGLDYAHRAGVIHRDIKPGNLMIDDDGEVIVTDFGLARVETEVHLTNAYKLMGTLPYMSPEQAFAARASFDHRSDIYSLGATLYELLTLRKLVDAPDPAGILKMLADDDPPHPRKLNKAIPRDLEYIVLKATEKDPLDRYATAEEFAKDLERFLDGKDALAGPVGLMARGRRLLRRPARSWPMVALAVCVLALVILSLWSYQLSQRDQNLRATLQSRAWEEFEVSEYAAAFDLLQAVDKFFGLSDAQDYFIMAICECELHGPSDDANKLFARGERALGTLDDQRPEVIALQDRAKQLLKPGE